MLYITIDENNKVVSRSGSPFPKSIYILSEPLDTTFYEAWYLGDEQEIVEDFKSSVEVAHKARRSKREELFKPYDIVIMKQIPDGSTTKAELERVKIREWDAELQIEIDQAFDVAELRTIMKREVL